MPFQSPGAPATPRRGGLPAWTFATVLVVVGANTLASGTVFLTIAAMRGVSEFALAVREYEKQLLPYWIAASYCLALAIGIAYLRPIVTYFRHGPASASPLVQRRVVSAPLVLTAAGFVGWLASLIFFPLATLHRFGRWSPDLMSQQIWSPLVNGFLAAAISYFFVDWVFRRMVVPRVFPTGGLTDIEGALALHMRGRLLVFLIAVAFTPLFTILGVVRAASARLGAGYPIEQVMPLLVRASEITFAVYVLLGIALALVLARTFTRPLADMASTLRRIQAGDLRAGVRVTSSDEVGVLEDGVNAMVAALRDRDRILQTFGRIVEPSVRDRLLSGAVELGGELRTATVLFCDLRGFTAMAEHAPPQTVVATLNQFFAAMTAWVRECGGSVDKFIGDALLVVFGLFDTDSVDTAQRSAAAGLRCAIGMRGRLQAVNAERAAAGAAPLSVKIGIHTGPVLAGLIGAADRHEYTVIGDTVNVAARLQQLTAEYGVGVLASEATYARAVQAGLDPPVTLRTALTLRGREESVEVFGIDA